MSESSNTKRRIGLIAGLVFAASLASCAVVPGPFGLPHFVDITVGSSVHHGHHRGHGNWRRGHRRGGGHHRHHRRHGHRHSR